MMAARIKRLTSMATVHTRAHLRGKPVSGGYAQGPAAFWGHESVETPRRHIPADEIDTELERFRAALQKSRSELQRLGELLRSDLGPDEAEIVSAHLHFLTDPEFIERVEDIIRQRRVCAEWAVRNAVDSLANVLQEADDGYLRERTADLRDLGNRVLRHIAQIHGLQSQQIKPGSILIARELLPFDLLEIEGTRPAGVVTEIGGEAGHAAILARALGVPAVTGIPDALLLAKPGVEILIDGKTGEVIIDPSPERRHVFAQERAQYDRSAETAAAAEQLECVTRDGVPVRLYANIGREHEAGLVGRHRLRGVGLFRTEYLFLNNPVPPSGKDHQAVYRRVAARLEGHPLIIRTLDLGGDKCPDFLAPRFEANRNLGIRGLQLSLLTAADLFRTQVKAILRVATALDVRILLPMVLGSGDFCDAMAVIKQSAEEEQIEHLPPVGALIETPAAVFSVQEILSRADFISIGTNDLTQFMLAADRNALATIDDYTALHPSVLRAIGKVVEAARAANKPVSVCGEAAADARYACLLVGLGIHDLSMTPSRSARVRFAIRATSQTHLGQIAGEALACDTPRRVSEMLEGSLREPLREILVGQAPALDVV